MRVKNNLNAVEFPILGETNNGKSETVPNQALTVIDMIGRANRGMPVNVSSREVHYDEEYEDPQIWRMDNIDKAEYMHKLADQYEDMQKRKAARDKEHAEKEAQRKKEEDEIRAFIKARNEAKNGQSGASPENGSGATEH